MISSVSEGGSNIALITMVCGWTFFAIALISVNLVLWVRRRRSQLGLDDCLTILALATTTALVVHITWGIVVEGQDQHEARVPKTKFALIVRVGLYDLAQICVYWHERKSLLVNEALWGLVNTFIRMSAIMLSEKIFFIFEHKWISRSVLILSVLYGLVIILEIFLICRPMAVDWNASINGKCGNQIVSYVGLEILGLLLVFIIIMIPIPSIWSLRMDRARRFRILIVFSIGIL